MYLSDGVRLAAGAQGRVAAATQNAWKIWVNGQSLFSRNEYHRGSMFDQYRVPVLMRAGRNTILLKTLSG